MTDTAAPPPERSFRSGFAFGLAAYASWGLFPIYFKAVAAVPALEVLAHRVVWSVVVLAIVLTVQRRWREVSAAVTEPRTLGVLGLTALLIGGNWYLFIWAVTTGHLLQASLGYFINPLVNVFLGVVFLLIVGLGFKVSVVPFHFWAPDIYEGASNTTTTFIATVPKVS